MRPLQRRISRETGVRPAVDPAEEIASRVGFLADYLVSSGASGFVLGISGGVDSTAAGRLAQLAVERVRESGGEAVFVGVRLPYREQHDEEDAVAALDFVAADEVCTVDIAPGVDGLDGEVARATGESPTDFTKGNVKARLRMVAQYAVAGDRDLLVVGADQAAESVTGYFTKFGDGAADLMPLSSLNKRQVRAVLRQLGAPRRLWEKVPTADLLDEHAGLTDEDQLGLRYDDIDDFLEGRVVPDAAARRIEDVWWRSRHKRAMPVAVSDEWWRERRSPAAGRIALLVIDMQNSYFEFDGLADHRDELLERVNELIRAAHAADRPVILVRTEHREDGATWTLNMCEDGEGFAYPGTEQSAFLSGLVTGDHIGVVKTRDNAFFGTSLRAELDRLGVEDLLLCGVSTHSCVAQTAMAAFDENLRASVAVDAVASADAGLSGALLRHLEEEKRQPLLGRSASLRYLAGEG